MVRHAVGHINTSYLLLLKNMLYAIDTVYLVNLVFAVVIFDTGSYYAA